MNKITALRIAIAAIMKRRKKLAFDANAARKYGFDAPVNRRALRERERLSQAIQILQEMKEEYENYN